MQVGLCSPVSVPTGQQQDEFRRVVGALVFDVLTADFVVYAAAVDDHGSSYEVLGWKLIKRPGLWNEVGWRIDMSAGVCAHGQPLGEIAIVCYGGRTGDHRCFVTGIGRDVRLDGVSKVDDRHVVRGQGVGVVTYCCDDTEDQSF